MRYIYIYILYTWLNVSIYIQFTYFNGQTQKVWLFSREVLSHRFGELELHPEKVGKHFLRCGKKRGGNSAPFGAWLDVELPRFPLSTLDFRHQKIPTFEKESVIQHEMLSILHAEAPRIPRTPKHRNTERVEKPMAAEVFPVRLVLWAAKTWSHWPRWNLWNVALFMCRKRIRIRKKQFSIDVDIFFKDRKSSLPKQFSVVRRLGESVFVDTLGFGSSKDMKFQNGKFRYIIHYLRLSNASIMCDGHMEFVQTKAESLETKRPEARCPQRSEHMIRLWIPPSASAWITR